LKNHKTEGVIVNTNNREIIVRGIGNASTPPDLIVISMELETTEMDYEQTMQTATKQLDELRVTINSVGHEKDELKTTRFNINTKNEQYKDKDNNWKNRFAGYTCSHGLSLEFSLDMSLLGKTLGAISRCSAKPNFNIKFSVKDPTAISEQLLQSAIENAKWKATVLAKSAGVSLGDIQRIDYNWSELRLYSNTEYHMDDDIMCEAAIAPMDITPEDIKMTDSASITWAIK